jgi:anti-sigma28 factor (negative regulator of flagellin synthesis)
MFDPLRPDRVSTPAGPAQPQAHPQSQPPHPGDAGVQPNGAGPTKSDSVQISSAGRSLAGRIEADQKERFDPERVAELRTKVLTGAYNTLDVVDQVARRILTRGDL